MAEKRESTRNSESNIRKLAEGHLQFDELLIEFALRNGFYGKCGIAFVIANGMIQKIERVFEQQSQ